MSPAAMDLLGDQYTQLELQGASGTRGTTREGSISAEEAINLVR